MTNRITLFHDSNTKWTDIKAPWPVDLVEIPADEFADPDIVVKADDFPTEEAP